MATMIGIERLHDTRLYAAIAEIVPPELKAEIRKLMYIVRAILATGNPFLFTNVGIETTTICNRRCGYCPQAVEKKREQKHDRGKFMSSELFSTILDQLATMKFKGKLGLNGFGEPLLDPNIEDRVREARQKLPCVYITFFSNGDFLTLEKLRTLVAAGLNAIYITNHNPEGSQKKTLYDKIRALSQDPEVGKYVIYNEKLSTIRNRGGAVDPTRFAALTVGEIDTSHGCCVTAVNTLNITASGNVVICSDDFDETDVVGAISAGVHVRDIWRSAKFKAIRRDIKKHVFNCTCCRRCNVSRK